MTFAQPYWLLLLVLIPLPWLWSWRSGREQGRGLRFSSLRTAREAPQSTWARLRRLPAWLRTAALALAILALARPQLRETTTTRQTEGIDIVLVLDTSTSMRAQDFTPNRFEAAREVASEFIRGRTTDRVGLVVFAAEAYTQAPLTLDYEFLLRMLGQVEMGAIRDGTAIGTAVGVATSRLEESEAESKVMIVLTDGQNNQGEIDPLTAAEMARTLGIRVYTIGVGTKGQAPYQTPGLFGLQRRMVDVQIDEEMLTRIADMTGGTYFRATDKSALRDIYTQIGELETSQIDERVFTSVEERYLLFLLPAFLLLCADILLSTTRLRRFP